jgi:hypothetical protein
MSRYYRFALLIVLVAATLACGLITNPINNVRDTAETAQAAISAVPIETLKALPSAFPSLEALSSALPPMEGLEGLFDPTGEPVSAWNDVPIMPEATAGNEVGDKYSFRAPVLVEEVRTFYEDQLTALGWEQMMSLPGGSDAAVMVFTKDDRILTVTATGTDDEVIVVLALQ